MPGGSIRQERYEYAITFSGEADTPDEAAALLYELALGDLADLDRVEGHPASYRRKRLRVVDGEGYGRLAHVYILPVDAEAPPASDYLGVLWQAYQRLGFDHEPLVAAAGGAG